MCLALKDAYVVQRDKKPICFSHPYLNEEKYLVFKHNDVLGFYSFAFNEDKKTIESEGSKKVSIQLNEQEFNLFLETKKNIINDISRLISRFKNGSEKVLVFETGVNEFPFYLSSQIILENSRYSCKYQTALCYSFNMLLQSCARNLSFDTFTELNKVINQTINKKLLRHCPIVLIGDDKCYELTMMQIIEML